MEEKSENSGTAKAALPTHSPTSSLLLGAAAALHTNLLTLAARDAGHRQVDGASN